MPGLPPIDTLYRKHGPAVLRRARALLGDEQEAQELLHDVFTQLLSRPEQFEGRSSMTTFLYSVTTHAALHRLRKRRNRQRLLETHEMAPRTEAPRQETLALLRQLLLDLPEDLAQVAVYHYLDDMTQTEIASIMGCSRQWVTKLVARLRTRFSQELRQ